MCLLVFLSVLLCDVLFFFSSRRRHTSYIGDWSSDVCSSDLSASRAGGAEPRPDRDADGPGARRGADGPVAPGARSEERRVGKECRSRWSPGQVKKTDGDIETEDRRTLENVRSGWHAPGGRRV